MTPPSSTARAATALVLLLALGGCATFSADGGMDGTNREAQARIGRTVPPLRTEADRTAAQDLVAARLRQPLTADAAVEIAFANSPDLQARLAEIGIAEADLVQASRLRNPSFSFSRKANADTVDIERAILVNVAQALVIPLAVDIEKRRFAQAQLVAATHIVQTAAAARQAFYRAVAAQERVRYFELVQEAAGASAELARRMQEAGNYSPLQRMREQAFSADAATQLARARHTAVVERENLTRVLGLWREQTAYKLPDRLPDLPKDPTAIADAERTAIERRLDIQVASKTVESMEASLGLSRATPFLSIVESAGYINESKTGEPRENGYEIEISLPIFDWGDARLARSEAAYRQAVARALQLAINARSEIRENYSSYRTAYDIAKHYRDEIVPLRKKIAEENLLRYNGMLISVFELLADAREQIGSVNSAIEALRDFWLADTALQLAATTASPGSMAPAVPSAMPSGAPGGGH